MISHIWGGGESAKVEVQWNVSYTKNTHMFWVKLNICLELFLSIFKKIMFSYMLFQV